MEKMLTVLQKMISILSSMIKDNSSGETVSEMGSISNIINEMSEIVPTIATAVEEQATTNRQIAGNVAQAAIRIQDKRMNVTQTNTVAGNITNGIAEVDQTAGEMINESSQLNISMTELKELAEKLHDTVSRMKV